MNDRVCVVCGRVFHPTSWNNVFCKPECHKMDFLRADKVSKPNEFKIFIQESHPENKMLDVKA